MKIDEIFKEIKVSLKKKLMKVEKFNKMKLTTQLNIIMRDFDKSKRQN